MAPSIHEVAGQRGRQSGDRERREPRFERSPWTHVTCGERKNLQVTMWDGVKAIVIALSIAGGNPEDIQVSVVEDCLLVSGTAGNSSVSQSIGLPCPVETHPIRIEDDKGTLFVLLQKK